ncbi:MAG TPA: type VI secretion system baseplate subunit TssG [Polyangiaceae bacterium]
MASPDRPDARAVGAGLLEEIGRAPDRFDFFQVLRRIESAFAESARLGQGQHPSDDPVRITQEASLSFSPSAVRGLERTGGGAPRLVTSFLGLLGPNGPLPLHLTEYARDRQRNSGDGSLARFLDIFHHRILSLFYRAYANSQPTFDRDRPRAARFPLYVGALLGVPPSPEEGAIPQTFALYFAGRLAARTRNAEGLAAMVGSWFRVPARVEPFVGEWVVVPATARARLGGPEVGTRLGLGMALGQRAWLPQGRFRVEVGPLTAEQAEGFQAGGPHLSALTALVRMYGGEAMDWDARLVLDDAACAPCRLGRGTCLGRAFWLGKRPRTAVVRPPKTVPDRAGLG